MSTPDEPTPEPVPAEPTAPSAAHEVRRSVRGEA